MEEQNGTPTAPRIPDSIITTQRNRQTIVAELFFNHSGTETFRFLGSCYLPCETVSEEEWIAAIDAEQLHKKQEKGKRASERQKQKLKALREAAKAGDPESARQLAEQRKYQSEAAVKSYQNMKAAAKAGDPEAVNKFIININNNGYRFREKSKSG